MSGDADGHKPHKRGWADGSVGWGVQGHFGSDAADDGSQVKRRSPGSSGLVRNKDGLWVKQRREERSQSSGEKRRRGGESRYADLNEGISKRSRPRSDFQGRDAAGSAAEDDPESLQGAHPIETGQLRHPKGGQ
eukprot:scaffold624_cov214-Pinguiococcus_pyrenoidosus.AAC.9